MADEERIMNFRLRGPDLRTLDWIAGRLGLNKTDVVRMSLVHYRASLELGQPIHQVVPSEGGSKQDDAAQT